MFPLELAVFGVMMLLMALAQYSMKDTFGERVSSNLERAGSTRLASKWNKARGERVSKIGARIFAVVGGLILLAAAVIAIVAS